MAIWNLDRIWLGTGSIQTCTVLIIIELFCGNIGTRTGGLARMAWYFEASLVSWPGCNSSFFYFGSSGERNRHITEPSAHKLAKVKILNLDWTLGARSGSMEYFGLTTDSPLMDEAHSYDRGPMDLIGLFHFHRTFVEHTFSILPVVFVWFVFCKKLWDFPGSHKPP